MLSGGVGWVCGEKRVGGGDFGEGGDGLRRGWERSGKRSGRIFRNSWGKGEI